MTNVSKLLALGLALSAAGTMVGQAAPAPAAGTAPAKKTAPLKLQSLAPDTVADPFPPVNLKFFTADSPSVATVDGYLHSVLGYDTNRIWRVVAIQKTAAPGVSKVVALVSEKTANAKVQTATFFVLPDGKHLVADASGVQPFGATPYADDRAILQAKADGPFHGAASKNFELVEFADLQCPHCKEAQGTMDKLAADFPQAHIVYQALPLVDIHPFAEKAALYGICVAKKSNDAFFLYANSVYENQAKLTPEDGDKTLNDAVLKAGGDTTAVATCAASPETKAAVDASVKLANDLNVDQTPMLMVNGRLVPLGGIPYETLRSIVAFQAASDGIALPGAGPLTK